MKSIAAALKTILDKKTRQIETTLVGIVLGVDKDLWLIDVQLKHKIMGKTVVLKQVPIGFPSFNGCRIVTTPKIGDVVLLTCTKYDLMSQIRDENPIDEYLDIGPVFSAGNAIAITALVTDVEERIQLNDNEMTILHNTGSYIKFKANGNIEIKAPRVDIV